MMYDFDNNLFFLILNIFYSFDRYLSAPMINIYYETVQVSQILWWFHKLKRDRWQDTPTNEENNNLRFFEAHFLYRNTDLDTRITCDIDVINLLSS